MRLASQNLRKTGADVNWDQVGEQEVTTVQTDAARALPGDRTSRQVSHHTHLQSMQLSGNPKDGFPILEPTCTFQKSWIWKILNKTIFNISSPEVQCGPSPKLTVQIVTHTVFNLLHCLEGLQNLQAGWQVLSLFSAWMGEEASNLIDHKTVGSVVPLSHHHP